MKKVIKFVVLSCFFNPVVDAQVVTDGTMGAVSNLAGNNMQIPQSLGTTVGNNLFHSFSTFNINTGENATFTGANTLQNVISRVTGGQLSTIDGKLQSTIGSANFYLINPAGVTFGASATVDVPAAFHVSTANQINFAGGIFSATNPSSNVSTLTANPVSFGFLASNATGTLKFDGSNITLKPHQTLDLVANNITVQNNAYVDKSTYVVAPAGEIRMVAVQGAAEVSLQRTAEGVLPLPTVAPSATNAGNITIDSSNIDVSEDGAGRIAVWGGQISLTNNQHNARGDGFWSTRIVADNFGALNPAATGGITVQANTLFIDGGSVIQADSDSSGNAANIAVNAKTITINGFQKDIGSEAKGIASNAYDSGRGGTITVNADYLKIDGAGVPIGTEKEDGVGILSVNEDSATGRAGNIIVNAGKVDIINGGQISASSETDDKAGADAGNVMVTAGSLNILSGGQISSSTFNKGNAGVVTVNAGQLLIDRQGNVDKTGILTDTNLINADGDPFNPKTDSGIRGNAGTVTVTGGSVNLANGGEISSSTFATGKAGEVNVVASSVNINNASINATAKQGSTGNAGTVTVNAAQALNVSNNGTISSSTFGSGNAGGVLVGTDPQSLGAVTVVTGGKISSSTSLSGNAGEVSVAASSVNIDNAAINAIADSGSTGNAGTVTVNAAQTLNVSNNGAISSSTSGSGYAGVVSVTGNNVTVNAGHISSDTFGTGKGGDVAVTGNSLIALSNKGEISSTARTGSTGAAGTVNVTAPTITLDNSSIAATAEIGTTGQTGNVIVNGKQILNLANNAKITLQNDATVANPAAIIPTTLTVTSPNISLTNSNITTAASGNIKASDIVVNFADKLLMDPSFILTTANTGDGGSIYINGGKLIYLKDSGFMTSVFGANSNGGNIYTNAGFLIMDTGVIQANAIGGFGGNVNLTLQGLIASYDHLILGGSTVNWQPFVPGLNVIQAASATGVSGNVNITSPQFNISGITKGLDAGSLILPAINRNPCQNVAGNSLKRSGKGGLPIDEEKDDFIPAVKVSLTSTGARLSSTAAHASQSMGNQPCAGTSL